MRGETQTGSSSVCVAEEVEPTGEVPDAPGSREAAQDETASGQLSPSAAEPALRNSPSQERSIEMSSIQVRISVWMLV